MKRFVLLTVVVIIVVTTLAGALWLAAAFAVHGGIIPRRTFVSAEYDRMHFGGEGSQFGGFTAGGLVHDYRIPEVLIKMPDGTLVYLPEMAEMDIATIANKVEQSESIQGQKRVIYALEGGAEAWFSEGRLILFSFNRDDPYKVGPQAEGEFIELPVTKSKMIEVFGRPKRYTYSHPKPV